MRIPTIGKISGVAVLAVIATFGFAVAQSSSAAQDAPVSRYAGQENFDIKSLSPDDIAELRRGGGWGMARSAELNGVPGPAHLLELKDQIPLTPGQISAIEAVYAQLKADASAEGENLIALERKLEAKFRSREVTAEILSKSLDEIYRSYRNLRFIHLSTHLSTPDLLTEVQITRYNKLFEAMAAMTLAPMSPRATTPICGKK